VTAPHPLSVSERGRRGCIRFPHPSRPTMTLRISFGSEGAQAGGGTDAAVSRGGATAGEGAPGSRAFSTTTQRMIDGLER
jgi:hypothetical protein